MDKRNETISLLSHLQSVPNYGIMQPALLLSYGCVRSYLRVDAQNVVALWASITNNIYVGADMKMSRFALAAV